MKKTIKALMLLICFGSASQTALAAEPPTYAQCAELALSDDVCHQRIASAGGVSTSAPQTAQELMFVEMPKPIKQHAIVLRGADGLNAKDRWYQKYVLYARDYGARVESKSTALRSYPRYPSPKPTWSR